MRIQIFYFSMLLTTAGIVYAAAVQTEAPEDFSTLEGRHDDELANIASHLSDADLASFSEQSKRFAKIAKAEFETRASWLWKNGKITPTLPFHAHNRPVLAVFVTNNGNIVSVGDSDFLNDHRIYVWQWDGKTYQKIQQMTDDIEDQVMREEFSPAKNILVLAHENNIVNVWNVQEGKKISQFDIGGWLIALSPDGTSLAVTIGDPQTSIVDLWDITTAIPRKIKTLPIHGNITIFSLNGKELAAQNVQDKYVSIWNVESGTLVNKYKFTTGPIGFVKLAFWPDGQLGGYSVFTDQIVAWDVQMNKHRSSDTYSDYNFCADQALSHNRSILATLSRSKRAIVLWHTQSLKIIQKLNCPCFVNTLGFSPDDKMIVAGCSNGDFVTWKATLPKN